MKMIDWVSGFVSGPSTGSGTAEELERTLADLEAEEAQGLNFKSAIEAHMKWKARLSRYVAGTSDERLDASVVCQADQCVLGKWIYGVGSANYGADDLFNKLKTTHTEFHTCAGRVISEADNGNTEHAASLLNEGHYPRISREITYLLARLFIQFQ